MARKRPNKLTHAFVNSVSTAGRYGDARGGHGLSLLVKATTIPGRWSKTWSQTLRVNRYPVPPSPSAPTRPSLSRWPGPKPSRTRH